MNEFSEAKIVLVRSKWDLMVIQVDLGDVSEIGKLACDGSLANGEMIMCVSHPHNLVGSFYVGHAVYQCVNDATVPLRDDPSTCGGYVSTALTNTPQYRQLGHVCNKKNFRCFDQEDICKFEELNPLLPIIQCNRLNFREGCSGSPVFNTKGEIVGMLICEVNSCDIALHVTVLKEFLSEALVKMVCLFNLQVHHIKLCDYCMFN